MIFSGAVIYKFGDNLTEPQ